MKNVGQTTIVLCSGDLRQTHGEVMKNLLTTILDCHMEQNGDYLLASPFASIVVDATPPESTLHFCSRISHDLVYVSFHALTRPSQTQTRAAPMLLEG